MVHLVQELPFFRAIICKGAKYPPTLPRPNVNILPFQLPLCELTTEKGQMEVSHILILKRLYLSSSAN